MSNVSGLFKDLTTVKKARNGRLASWDQRGKNQDYWEIPAGETISLGDSNFFIYFSNCYPTSFLKFTKKLSIIFPIS